MDVCAHIDTICTPTLAQELSFAPQYPLHAAPGQPLQLVENLGIYLIQYS